MIKSPWAVSTAIKINISVCMTVNQPEASVSASGGKKNTKYQEATFSLLVHWTTSPVTASAKAMEIYNLLYGLSGEIMDGMRTVKSDPGGQPEWAGRDTRRVCEYVIRLKLTYERMNKNGN